MTSFAIFQDLSRPPVRLMAHWTEPLIYPPKWNQHNKSGSKHKNSTNNNYKRRIKLKANKKKRTLAHLRAYHPSHSSVLNANVHFTSHTRHTFSSVSQCLSMFDGHVKHLNGTVRRGLFWYLDKSKSHNTMTCCSSFVNLRLTTIHKSKFKSVFTRIFSGSTNVYLLPNGTMPDWDIRYIWIMTN